MDAQIGRVSRALHALASAPAHQPHLYVTDGDITSLPCFAQDTLFAVKAPPSAVLEVPEPQPQQPQQQLQALAAPGNPGSGGSAPQPQDALHYRWASRKNCCFVSRDCGGDLCLSHAQGRRRWNVTHVWAPFRRGSEPSYRAYISDVSQGRGA